LNRINSTIFSAVAVTSLASPIIGGYLSSLFDW